MKRLTLLLTPSWLSGWAALICAALLLGTSAWSYVQYNELYTNWIFGQDGARSLLFEDPGHWEVVRHVMLESTISYYVMLVLAGALASVVTYAVLDSLLKARIAAEEVVQEVRSDGPNYWVAINEALARSGIRMLSMVGWSVYLVFWFNLLYPLCTLLIDAASTKLAADSGIPWFELAVSYALLAISLHVHVIWLRLCYLRPRVFGKFIEEDN